MEPFTAPNSEANAKRLRNRLSYFKRWGGRIEMLLWLYVLQINN
jgi:hypothetical protein